MSSGARGVVRSLGVRYGRSFVKDQAFLLPSSNNE